jgi:hypothetical protein
MTWPTKTDFVDGDVLTAAQVNNIGTNLNLADPTGITDGYVLTADGAGSMGWEQVAAGGMTLLASGSFAAGVGTTTVSSINQTYNSLELWVTSAPNTNYQPFFIMKNGATTLTQTYGGQVDATNVGPGTGGVLPMSSSYTCDAGDNYTYCAKIFNYSNAEPITGYTVMSFYSTGGPVHRSAMTHFSVNNVTTQSAVDAITIYHGLSASGGYKIYGIS